MTQPFASSVRLRDGGHILASAPKPRRSACHGRLRVRFCPHDRSGADETATPTITIPFTPTSLPQKGVRHVPAAGGSLSESDRIALLTAIARSKAWVGELLLDPTADFKTISEREKLAERHVRFLAPLAYLSPRIVEAIAEGRAPADLAVRRLARNLPLAWAEQERSLYI